MQPGVLSIPIHCLPRDGRQSADQEAPDSSYQTAHEDHRGRRLALVLNVRVGRTSSAPSDASSTLTFFTYGLHFQNVPGPGLSLPQLVLPRGHPLPSGSPH